MYKNKEHIYILIVLLMTSSKRYCVLITFTNCQSVVFPFYYVWATSWVPLHAFQWA